MLANLAAYLEYGQAPLNYICGTVSFCLLGEKKMCLGLFLQKVGSLAQNCLALKSLLNLLDFGSYLLLLYSSTLALDLVPT